MKTEVGDRREILGTLHALGHQARAQVEADRLAGPDGGALGAVIRDPVNQRAIDLDEVGPQLEDVAQRCVPRARVVDGDPEPLSAQRGELVEQRRVVVDHGVLGDLDDQLRERQVIPGVGAAGELEQRVRSDVDREELPTAEFGDDAPGLTDHEAFEFESQSDGLCRGEGLIGRPERLPEARERLDSGARSPVQVHDRLQRDLDALLVYQLYELCSERLCAAALCQLIEHHLAEHRQESRIPPVEVRSRCAADATEGTERLPVGQPQRHADEGADRGAVQGPKIRDPVVSEGVGHHHGDLARDQPAAERCLVDGPFRLPFAALIDRGDRIAHRDPERIRVTGDGGVDVRVLGELGDVGRVELEVAARQLDDPRETHRFELGVGGLVHDLGTGARGSRSCSHVQLCGTNRRFDRAS
ncbi:MAG TPA: hypothetical protein VHT27_05255 [Solirubrobacteraceae bacterium]|nr:hypothetical protein [Solirubrobacteraceae bacterium]